MNLFYEDLDPVSTALGCSHWGLNHGAECGLSWFLLYSEDCLETVKLNIRLANRFENTVSKQKCKHQVESVWISSVLLMFCNISMLVSDIKFPSFIFSSHSINCEILVIFLDLDWLCVCAHLFKCVLIISFHSLQEFLIFHYQQTAMSNKR